MHRSRRDGFINLSPRFLIICLLLDHESTVIDRSSRGRGRAGQPGYEFCPAPHRTKTPRFLILQCVAEQCTECKANNKVAKLVLIDGWMEEIHQPATQ
jgi:hypothetical protein